MRTEPLANGRAALTLTGHEMNTLWEGFDHFDLAEHDFIGEDADDLDLDVDDLWRALSDTLRQCATGEQATHWHVSLRDLRILHHAARMAAVSATLYLCDHHVRPDAETEAWRVDLHDQQHRAVELARGLEAVVWQLEASTPTTA